MGPVPRPGVTASVPALLTPVSTENTRAPLSAPSRFGCRRTVTSPTARCRGRVGARSGFVHRPNRGGADRGGRFLPAGVRWGSRAPAAWRLGMHAGARLRGRVTQTRPGV